MDENLPDADVSRFALRDVPAEAHHITDARKRFGRWLDGTSLGASRSYDVLLAVYEAMANVVEHAYASSASPSTEVFEVRAELSTDTGRLDVTVSDHGSWSTADPGPMRGRGLPLIETLSDDVGLSCSDEGTLVTMTWNTVAPDASSNTDSTGSVREARSVS